jgi:hypothetical protein
VLLLWPQAAPGTGTRSPQPDHRRQPCPHGSAQAADGTRPADGYMIDSKYVKDDGKNCWRKPETVDQLEDKYHADGKMKWNRGSFFKGLDEGELGQYRDAMTAHKEIRGLSIVTNDKDAAAYWQTLMAQQGVKGTSQYVP